MSDMARPPARAPGNKAGHGVDALANRALDVVAKRTRVIAKSMSPEFLNALHDASVSADGIGMEALVGKMRRAGVSVEEITDLYIPAAARQMGDMWCEDQLSFATVTIGVARLQGLLRCINPCLGVEQGPDNSMPAVLVIVGADVFHTLGAMVLVAQMRRIGLSVTPMIGATTDQIGPALRRARYDAVLISASSGEALESLRKMVEQVKGSTATPPPVVIGGTVIETAAAEGIDIRTLTGADHVTSDLYEALSSCALTLKPRVVSNPAPGARG
jgi:methanogenic corrinoid protein MtbC1